MPITATMEPPFGRRSARAEFGFDVFDAVEPLAVLLAELAVVLAAAEDVVLVETARPMVEDVTQDEVAGAG